MRLGAYLQAAAIDGKVRRMLGLLAKSPRKDRYPPGCKLNTTQEQDRRQRQMRKGMLRANRP